MHSPCIRLGLYIEWVQIVQHMEGSTLARRASTTRTPKTDIETSWQADAAAWMLCKQSYDAAKKEMEKYRSRLLAALDAEGTEDENGHRFLYLEEPVGPFAGIQRQRRVSDTLDEERAMQILEERDLLDSCVKMVPQIDQDAVFAALYDRDLTEADIEAMFPPKVTYALVAVKA